VGQYWSVVFGIAGVGIALSFAVALAGVIVLGPWMALRWAARRQPPRPGSAARAVLPGKPAAQAQAQAPASEEAIHRDGSAPAAPAATAAAIVRSGPTVTVGANDARAA
jgi:predicted lipid-binding transport protein (Tim44 family)